MRLAEKHRPCRLDEVVGQTALNKLRGFARSPYSSCWLLTGDPGIGKSAGVLALAAELGARDEFSGLTTISASSLTKDEAFDVVRRLSLRPFSGAWNVLIIEELEWLGQQAQVFLKMALASERLPALAIVLATSNDVSRLDPAFVQRFSRVRLESGARLATACQERLLAILRAEAPGLDPPGYWRNWGFENGACGGASRCGWRWTSCRTTCRRRAYDAAARPLRPVAPATGAGGHPDGATLPRLHGRAVGGGGRRWRALVR